jgi:hypothetical protein
MDIARDLGLRPSSADHLIRRAWAWTKARHVEADPRDLYAQVQEELRLMAQMSMVGLQVNRPSTREGATDKSLEFMRYGLQLLRARQMSMRVMEKFGVMSAMAGTKDSDRERQSSSSATTSTRRSSPWAAPRSGGRPRR